MRIEVSGTPSPEEVAAIAAAVEMAWPRAVTAEFAVQPAENAWRWSGRWWRNSTRTWPPS